jgi:hypothetical protein
MSTGAYLNSRQVLPLRLLLSVLLAREVQERERVGVERSPPPPVPGTDFVLSLVPFRVAVLPVQSDSNKSV